MKKPRKRTPGTRRMSSKATTAILRAAAVAASSGIDWDVWIDALFDQRQRVARAAELSDAADNAFDRWEDRNPRPRIVMWDDPDYETGKLEMKRWQSRTEDARRCSGRVARYKEYETESAAWKELTDRVSRLPAKTLADVKSKAWAAYHAHPDGRLRDAVVMEILRI